MRIAISSTGPSLDSDVDPRFGRAAYFVIYDIDNDKFEGFANPNVDMGSGAGIQTARMVIEKGASAILTGNCGPKAYDVCCAAGIDIYAGVNGSVAGNVEAFKKGELTPVAGPNVEAHANKPGRNRG